MRRREFLVRVAAGGVAVAGIRSAAAQETGAPAAARSNLFDMNQDAARRVQRPAKSGARPSMSDDQRDAMEHELRCQCGCTLDVYTCRTTDFSCEVSPAMHRDVMALVEGGYSAPEIISAFVDTYGERVLMAPRKEGFNWAGYVVPFAALGAAAAAVATVLRGMQRRDPRAATTAGTATTPRTAATAEELARLDAAIRRDD